MPIVVVGLNHKTAPVELLERLAVTEEDVPKALHQLSTYDHVLEAALLSTCNRVEIYAVVSKFHAGTQDIRNFFAEFCHVAPEDFVDHLYSYHEDGAVAHLFRVAAGVDSMVVGESEILGQVRRAYQAAVGEGSVQRVLGAAFQSALRVGKRARTETAIGRNPTSISSAAVELARRAFASGTLEGKRVAIVGAGKMGTLAARALARSGAMQVTVVNRSLDRALQLAARFGAEARSLDDLQDVLRRADIVICSTTAPRSVIDRPLLESVVATRSEPVFIVDIAVPRDVDPSVGDIDGVILRDIDDLRAVVETGVGSRAAEVSKVEEIVAAEVHRFIEWERSTEVTPTITALLNRAEAIRLAELRQAAAGPGRFSAAQEAALDALTTRMMGKILHVPITKAKELASSKQGHLYVSALRELFELDDDEGS